MEANEAPEKIYIQRRNSYNNILGYDSEWTPIPLISEDNVEYTRTDVFIEKACQWFENYLFDIGYPDDWCRDSPNIESGKEKFIKAMKGE